MNKYQEFILYLYFNYNRNWKTIHSFADFYGLDVDFANSLIREGKRIQALYPDVGYDDLDKVEQETQ